MTLDDTLQKAVDALVSKIEPLEERIRPLVAEADRLRTAVNAIYAAAGEPPKYVLGEAGAAPTTSTSSVKYGRGEFHNKPLLTAVKQIIGDHGPQSRDELFVILRDHDYDFGGRSEKDAKDGLAISLGKAHGITKLSNGRYALAQQPARKRWVRVDDQDTNGESSAEPDNAEGGAS